MRQYSRIFKADSYRILTSKNFYIAIILLFICFVTANIADIESAIVSLETVCGMGLIDQVMTFTYSQMYYVTCMAIGTVPIFIVDKKSGYIDSVVSREGSIVYGIMKAITTIIYSCLICMIAFTLYVFVINMIVPFTPEDERIYEYMISGSNYRSIFDAGYMYTYLFVHTLHAAFSMSIWVMLGLVVATYMSDTFVAVTSTTLSFYVFMRITCDFPGYMNVDKLTLSYNLFDGPALVQIIYNVTIILLLNIILTVVFTVRVNRLIGGER